PLNDVEEMSIKKDFPSIPDEYISFMKRYGYGEIKEKESSWPILTISRSLVVAEDYFGDDNMYIDGPYEPGAKGKVLIFGYDVSGNAIGFDSGDGWRLVEIDNMRWVMRLNLSFSEYVEGLFACYPQTPIRFSDDTWY